jgi:elongation factor G
MDVKNKRNFILLGHAQSGKTTLSESILHLCKATTRKGKISDGTTLSDYNADEIERKISISLGFVFCDYKGRRLQIIDAPGYADFFGEVIAGVRAADAAVLVVDAATGIEVGTEKAWALVQELKLPCIIFINKSDKEGVEIDRVLSQIQQTLSKKAKEVKSFTDSELVEAIAESDDRLLERYLEGQDLSEEELKNGLREAVINGKVFPVFSGSALSDRGVETLLEAVLDYLPSPQQRQPIYLQEMANPENKKEITLNETSDFFAFVFKSIFDPYVGQLTIMRIFSGRLSANTGFYNINKNVRERIGQIYILQGKEQRPLEAASCGDIVAVAKLKETQTQDTLCTDSQQQFIFAPISFPEAAISRSAKPKSRQDEEKISAALSKLVIEDPTFKVTRDAQTKELIISGLGDLHLDIMVGRMKRRFNVDVELGTPKVSYKETITKTAKVQGKYKRQSGGRGQYGDVWIEVQPLEKGADFEFVDKIFGGAIPKNYIPAVEKGVRQAMSEGVLAGYPLVDMRVILYDGSYHEVDSSDLAFQIAGAMALRKAALEAAPVLLEPIMEVEVLIPEEYLGAISGDLNSRRGRIMGMEAKGKNQIVKAQVPLAQMFQYANDLRSMTGGRGSYTMHFSHYEQVPHKVACGIISKYQASKEEQR